MRIIEANQTSKIVAILCGAVTSPIFKYFFGMEILKLNSQLENQPASNIFIEVFSGPMLNFFTVNL